MLRAQHLSDGRVDVTVEKIQLETGKAGGQVGVRTLLIDHKADRNIGHNQTGIDVQKIIWRVEREILNSYPKFREQKEKFEILVSNFESRKRNTRF